MRHSTKKMKTLIIDGNNLVHRTYWTAKTQSKRTNTDTPEQLANFHIYFTLNAIFSYVSKYQPLKTIVVWDEKPDYQQNTRKAEFADYKGNRSGDSAPHENNSSIKRMLSYLGISSIFPRTREADDIVAYICKTIEGKKIIISVDKDFLQLVSDEVTLFDPIRKKEYTTDNFEEETGCKNIEDWMVTKCCLGDKSDNVPGIEKFGKSKIKRFIDGEITLNEDQIAIYDRNFKLFSLEQIMNLPAECEYYQKQLDASIQTNWMQFLQECQDREFNSILKKKEAWHTLFFLKHKLASLFT